MVSSLKMKQYEQEMRFIRSNLETKIKENQSLTQSLSILKERENRREEQRNSVRTKQELQQENSSLLRVNEKMKGEILILQEQLRLLSNKKEEIGRMPLRGDRFENMRVENQNLLTKAKNTEHSVMQLKMELNQHILEKNRALDKVMNIERQLRECKEVVIQMQAERTNLKNALKNRDIQVERDNVPQIEKLRFKEAQIKKYQLRIMELEKHVVQLTQQLKKWIEFDSKSKSIENQKNKINSVHSLKSCYTLGSQQNFTEPFRSLSPQHYSRYLGSTQQSRPVSALAIHQSIGETLKSRKTLDQRVEEIKKSLKVQNT